MECTGLAVEHGLQRGRTLRLDVDAPPGAAHARLLLHADRAPHGGPTTGDALPGQLLALLAGALGLPLERQAGPGGELLVLQLPRPAA